jgi:hypothetical protein
MVLGQRQAYGERAFVFWPDFIINSIEQVGLSVNQLVRGQLLPFFNEI